ncbi:MAG: DinB family protein [Acidobacteriota bacterium]|nr:DinB family protein [Acidobacteriota bacterium]
MASTPLRELLAPELEFELDRTRRILNAIPDSDYDFKPHEKSMSLGKLASHTAELPGFTHHMLSGPSIDFASPETPRKPFAMESKEHLLRHFDVTSAQALETLKHTSDEKLGEVWSLSRGELTIFSGTRYGAYRAFGVNHIIHHRAQLGTYIRLLNRTLPGTYGPSADGM